MRLLPHSLVDCSIMILYNILLTFAAVESVSYHKRDVRDALAFLEVADIPAQESHCTSCSASDSNAKVKGVEEKDINELRIQFIKSQILKKLNLNGVPNVGKTSFNLPASMATFDQQFYNDLGQEYMSSSIGATTNQIILTTTTKESHLVCDKLIMCIGFTLPQELQDSIAGQPQKITSAELWLFTKKISGRSEDFIQIDNENMTKLRTYSEKIKDGWIRINYTTQVSNMLYNKIFNPTLKISCTSCEWLEGRAEMKPLLVINFERAHERKRQKRQINCQDSGGVNECCREKLYVNFKDVGWDGWVIQPEGYHAYFCTGSCSTASSAAASASLHTSLRRKVFGHTKRVELIPCCAATEHSSMTLIYRVDNQTITKKTLPNMVVETCGCM